MPDSAPLNAPPPAVSVVVTGFATRPRSSAVDEIAAALTGAGRSSRLRHDGSSDDTERC